MMPLCGRCEALGSSCDCGSAQKPVRKPSARIPGPGAAGNQDNIAHLQACFNMVVISMFAETVCAGAIEQQRFAKATHTI